MIPLHNAAHIEQDPTISISKQTRLTLGLVVLLLIGTATTVIAQMTWQASVNANLQSIGNDVKAQRIESRNFHSVMGVLNPELTMPPDFESTGE